MLGRSIFRSAFKKVISSPTQLRVANNLGGALRFLNLHEYQSKDLLERYNVTVQFGKSADTSSQARHIGEEIKARNPNAELVVKAQIHAGGRGKGHFNTGFKGGVKIATTVDEVEYFAQNMLGNRLITKQTGPEGQLCSKVLINEGITILEETYVAVLMDRAHNGPVIVSSRQGGVDIEQVAEKTPEAIFVEPVDIMSGITDEQCYRVATNLGFKHEDLIRQAANNIKSIYHLFLKTDATQVEINPFAVASDGNVYAVDAKFNFDDNAAFRQKDIFALRDRSMEDPRDVRAEASGLNYIGLDGNIGCLVNGAGLAMATMDIIQLNGGKPANFLDVGGSATKEQVTEAFKILVSDDKVKGILVNIFGGIMRCDIIAEGIIAAHKEVGLNVPLVVRLAGTNVEKGKEILQQSGLPIITADNLDEAAAKAVASAKI